MTQLFEIRVPDVGNVAEIDVVEVLIKAGDVVELEQTVATLETDKASMELPSSATGTIQEVYIKPGDKVSEGTLIATVLASAGSSSAAETAAPTEVAVPVAPVVEKAPEPIAAPAPAPAVMAETKVSIPALDSNSSAHRAHASPSVRLFARELGVDVAKISTGSGRKGRI